jgi:arylsulfate sulfotransferase
MKLARRSDNRVMCRLPWSVPGIFISLVLSWMLTLGQDPALASGVGDDSSTSEPWFVAPPRADRNPIDRAPLVAIVEWESRREAVASVEIEGGGKRWVQSNPRPASTRHRVAVMGLQPDTAYRFRIRLQIGREQQHSGWIEYQTPPLPANFPPLSVQRLNPVLEASPGVYLFAANLWIDNESMLDYGYIIAIDQSGAVVWYCQSEERIADIVLLRNGNLLYQHANYQQLREIDWLGRVVRSWYAGNLLESPDAEGISVPVDTMHHEVVELPNGNFLTLATQLVEFQRFPASELDPHAGWKAARVVCDEVVEFRPEDGTIVHRFPLERVLDKERIGYMSLGNFWRDKYDREDVELSYDWSHANGLVYDSADESVIVSLRHLDCLLKLDWPTGELRWILGNHDGWGAAWRPYLLQPIGELEWFFHQHSPLGSQRGLLLYDNGNYRARPYTSRTPAEENASRVVEYAIDEESHEVRQGLVVGRFGGETVYCPFYGEAEWIQPGQRLLVTHGGRIEREDGTPMDQVPGERQWAEIIELDVASQELVWRVTLDSGLQSRYGWSIYRCLRLDALPTPAGGAWDILSPSKG